MLHEAPVVATMHSGKSSRIHTKQIVNPTTLDPQF
jgi:hypothetical protein